MAEQSFRIVYDGPALTTGAMPVRELAPALLALAEIFTAASVVHFPGREPVSLHIKATHEGSFDVDLILASKRVFDETVDIFSSNPATALQTLVSSIVGARAGLFWLIKTMRGRRVIEKVPDEHRDGWVTLTLEDGESLTVPTAVAELYTRSAVRSNAREVVEPLRRDGIESVTFRVDHHDEERIDVEDLAAYDDVPAEEEESLETVQPMVLDVTQPTFVEGNRWGFFDGDRRFTAAIEDAEFLARVEAGEPFAKGDTLRCDVRIKQARVEGRLQVERAIVRVNEHVRRDRRQLDFDDLTGAVG